MTNLTICPDSRQLQQLVLGLLSADQSEQLERHVEGCSRCGQTLRGLNTDDGLVDTMRSQPASVDLPAADRRAIEQMIPRMERLGAELPPQEPSATTAPPDRPRDIADMLSPPQQPDELGRLGPYRVLRLLGQGGMGLVFVADDPQLQRQVALKVMLPEVADQSASRERFLREARAAAKIQHDHIVTVYQVGEDRDVLYVAMQLLPGMSLEDFLRQREAVGDPPLALGELLRLGREIALGLAAAHQQGLVHRDIKPGNIWLDASAGGRIKLLDFGLAQPLEEDPTAASSGMLAGTLAYMAPEQVRGESVDARSDLFSLGCVLYRLCTGRVPWRGRDKLSTLLSSSTEIPTPVEELNPELPAELSELVMRLLAREPASRPESAQQVVTALEQIGRESLHVKANRSWQRRRVGWIAVGAAAAMLLGAIVYVQTDAGLLTVQTTDDDVQVLVERNGQVVEIIDKKQGNTVRLHAGKYTLRVDGQHPDAQLDPNLVEIKRGSQIVATVRLEQNAAKAKSRQSPVLVNSIGMQLVRIPAGKFLMGSPPDEPSRMPDEKQHEVTISRPFFMGIYCVTVGEYGEFIAATSYHGEGADTWRSPGYKQGDDHPVGNVSWNDAVAFCKWLTQKEGREYRLPTEAEWEYACRAGTQTPYFFGSDPGLFSQYAYTLKDQAHPIAPLKPNAWGLYHMYGNQWQWMSDWYAADYYEHSPAVDPAGPASGVNRMMRGASIYMDAKFCRSAVRHGTHPPSWHKPYVGFRVVLVDAPQGAAQP